MYWSRKCEPPSLPPVWRFQLCWFTPASRRVPEAGRSAGRRRRRSLTVSGRVHSRYERKMPDTAISNQQTVLHLQIRRFFCGNSDCPKKTFAEQMPDLTFRHSRCTTLLRTNLRPIPGNASRGGPASTVRQGAWSSAAASVITSSISTN
ncbi:transposase family protein [Streptomyces sp. NPDC017890]|uniref:transposase family protein n=1 Tax=Streptomyces sp. NPDC017890 TaxID=3365015 RepID=UPI0037B92152